MTPTPRFVLGQKVNAGLSDGPVDHPDLGVVRLQPYLVQSDGKHYIGIVGALVMQNNDVVDHALMIIGPGRVVSVQPSSIYNISCSLAPPRGYSWGRRAGKRRFSITRLMNRYWNSQPEDTEAAGAAGDA